jgi:uncharacterized protein YhaN
MSRDALSQAKEQLAKRYMGKIGESFQKYIHMLRGEKGNPFKIDIDLNVKEEAQGELHSQDYLSEGNQDLVRVCIRMALVDSVYGEVPAPFILLDDPFNSFDDFRVENSKEFLKNLAKEYQIIYFTCHGSRK